MIKLQGLSLTPGEKFAPEGDALTLMERQSTARVTLGPEAPELAVGVWLLEDSGPGAGIVWRVKSIETTYNTYTRAATLEHIINTLRDVSIFGEVTAADMGGGAECTAYQAAQYVMGHQSIWRLGDFEYSTSAAYKFNGDDLFTALQTITSTLDDPWWDYDLSSLPFTLHIRRKSSAVACEMRMGRNLSTLRKTIDRSQMYTRVYPIGENDLHILGDYLSKNENQYGRKDKVLTNSGESNEAMLRIWAQDRLDKHCEPTVTITIAGLELSEATGEPLDHLVLGTVCRVPLPEFGTTITERITKLNWRDTVKEPENVTVTLCNTLQDVASIMNRIASEGAGSSGSAGRSKAKKDKEDHAWFIDTESHVGMVAEAIIGQGPDGVNWSRVAEIIVDGEGIHQQVVLAQGSIITMQGRQDMTEGSLTTVFEKTGIGSLDAGQTLYGMQVMSAESLTTVFQKTGINSLGQGETLYGNQVMNAESLTTVFQKTGINSLGQGETLYGNQVMNAESLTTVFQKTGINSLGQGETLYGNQVMNAESLATVFQKTGINSLGQGETLYGKVTQTAESLSTVYTKTGINSLGQGETLYSKVTQTAESLNSKVGKGEISSTINQTAQSVLIQASKINLQGYVTATELDAEKARFDNLTAGITHATALTASTLQADTILHVAGTNFLPRTIKIGSIISATVLSSARGDIDLDHYHNISISVSGGTVTVTTGKARLTAGSDSFNIADTAYYQNGVSAARPHSLSNISLSTSDFGNTVTKLVTVYCIDDEEYDLYTNITVPQAPSQTVSLSVYGNWIEADGTENGMYELTGNWDLYPGERMYVRAANNGTLGGNGYYIRARVPSLTFSWATSYIGSRFRINTDNEDSGLYGYLGYESGYVYLYGSSDNAKYARLYVADLFDND